MDDKKKFKSNENTSYGKLKVGTKTIIAKCSAKAKYILGNGWEKPDKNTKGKAFSIVSFNSRFGKRKTEKDYECFIIIKGSRPENYSENGSDSGWGNDKFLEAIDKLDGNFKVYSILFDKDAPHEKEAKLLAKYINKIKDKDECKGIHVLGISKGGPLAVASLKYLSENNLDKYKNLLLFMPPFLGTIFASPNLLFKKFDELPDDVYSPLISKMIPYLFGLKPNIDFKLPIKLPLPTILKLIFTKVFSWSGMDLDIKLVGKKGVPDKYKDRCDENYLINMFCKKTLDILKKIHVTNITTCCSDKTLDNSIKDKNMAALSLYVSSEYMFDGEANDGLVTVKSAKHIEKVCKDNDISISTLFIKDGHHDISSDTRIINEVINDRVLSLDRQVGIEQEL